LRSASSLGPRVGVAGWVDSGGAKGPARWAPPDQDRRKGLQVMDEHTSVGERIAYYRRRRGLTQVVLAGLVGRSPSWLVKIENGSRTVEAVKDLLALARVLKVELADLIGAINLPPDGGAPLDPPRGIPAIRRALFAARLGEQKIPAVTALRDDIVGANRLTANGRYEAVAAILPELILTARAAVAEEVPGAWWNLAAAYHVAAHLARNVDDRNLGLLAADRTVSAAARSGDELLIAVSMRDLAFALLRAGLLNDAGAVCSDGADAITPTEKAPLECWSLWGSLRLTEAVTASRAGQGGQAWRRLDDARAAADRVGPGRDDYWEAFGPANVGAHEVAVALEEGDAAEALRRADEVEVDELPTAGRRSRFLIDVATRRRCAGTTVPQWQCCWRLSATRLRECATRSSCTSWCGYSWAGSAGRAPQGCEGLPSGLG
jgi:transcriptional regulator with XRE-family HTH domain